MLKPLEKIAVDKNTWDFACSEFGRINRLLDLAEIPTHTNEGARYSAAQRVDILVRGKEVLHGAIRKASGQHPH